MRTGLNLLFCNIWKASMIQRSITSLYCLFRSRVLLLFYFQKSLFCERNCNEHFIFWYFYWKIPVWVFSSENSRKKMPPPNFSFDLCQWPHGDSFWNTQWSQCPFYILALVIELQSPLQLKSINNEINLFTKLLNCQTAFLNNLPEVTMYITHVTSIR